MKFEEMGLQARLVERMNAAGLVNPTPIQQQAIPHALSGRDVMGLAQTGTGKTAAFGVPLVNTINSLGKAPEPKTASGLILAPTRELAKQIATSLSAFTKGSHLKIAVVVGGVSINRQIETLRRGADILIATPGRLIDLVDRKAVQLGATKYLVLDEADQMLDMGFIHALRLIAPLFASERHTMLFSATMPTQMTELSMTFLNDPIRLKLITPTPAAA